MVYSIKRQPSVTLKFFKMDRIVVETIHQG